MRQRNRNRIESIIDSEGILTITLWIFNEIKRIETVVVLCALFVQFSVSIIIGNIKSLSLAGDDRIDWVIRNWIMYCAHKVIGFDRKEISRFFR